MIKKKKLLSSALTLTLFSPTSMAADINSPAEIQKTILPPLVEAALTATNGSRECVKIDDSTEAVWNAGEICLASDIDTSTKSFSLATDLQVAGLKVSQDILADSNPLGAECLSAGGSTATSDSSGGFCLALDISTSETNFASFSVANELPVTGMQFLQVTFGDGSTLAASAPMAAECISTGGSTSTPENAGGFCMASDLIRTTTDFANFSVANGLPAVGLQFIQVLLADAGSSPTGTGTECMSVGGSTATSGTGGFCLASDLNTATTGNANFSAVHSAPATDLQFLQITFGDSSLSGAATPQGAGAPIGAECISVEGSIGAIGNPNGLCLVSDLIGLEDSAAISFANDLPVSSMQFLQAKFTGGSTSPGAGAPAGAECVSADGSTAASANAGGFCLVSDFIVGSANFSVANDLPVTAWEFIQVPSATSLGGPVGVVISNFIELPFDLRTPSAAADIVGSPRTPFFHLSDQTTEMEVFSTPYWRLYPHLGLGVGR